MKMKEFGSPGGGGDPRPWRPPLRSANVNDDCKEYIPLGVTSLDFKITSLKNLDHFIEEKLGVT